MKNIELVHFIEWKKIPDEKFEETLRSAVSWGAAALVAHPCWGMKDETNPSYMENCAALFKKYGITTPACHAYWGKGNDISPENPAELAEILPRHIRFFRKLNALQVKTCTMHIGMESDGSTPWKTIEKAVETLLPEAEKNKIILALENGHENCAEQEKLAAFVRSFDHPCLGVCFDTGHAHCYGDRVWQKSLEILAPHIVTCHLHDNYGTFDDHNPPGEGNINWQEMRAALKSLPRLLHAETESGNWGEESWKKFCDMWNA